MISAAEATAQIFWTAFRVMPKKERDAIIERFLTEREFIEDVIDAMILKIDSFELKVGQGVKIKTGVLHP